MRRPRGDRRSRGRFARPRLGQPRRAGQSPARSPRRASACSGAFALRSDARSARRARRHWRRRQRRTHCRPDISTCLHLRAGRAASSTSCHVRQALDEHVFEPRRNRPRRSATAMPRGSSSRRDEAVTVPLASSRTCSRSPNSCTRSAPTARAQRPRARGGRRGDDLEHHAGERAPAGAPARRARAGGPR